jgi:hypothetical protein
VIFANVGASLHGKADWLNVVRELDNVSFDDCDIEISRRPVILGMNKRGMNFQVRASYFAFIELKIVVSSMD